MDMVIGSCSICGGNVVVPKVWYGMQTPMPTCSKCGAIEQLPVIKMAPTLTGGSKELIERMLNLNKKEGE
jgi:hypothetical protein